MKKGDIEVGKEYAYSTDQDHYRYPNSAARVRVLEHVEAKQRFGSFSPMPGVLVQALDRETGEPLTRMVLNDDLEATGETVVADPYTVPNRTIKEPWANFTANLKAMAERTAAVKVERAKREAKQAVVNNAVMDEIQRRVPEFGKGYGRYFFLGEERFRQGQAVKIEMTVEAMAELLGIDVESLA